MKSVRRAVFALSVASAACQTLLDFGAPHEAQTSADAADVSSGADGKSPLDASTDGGASFCNGLTAHFAFEGTLAGRGGRTAHSPTVPKYVAGHVGKGLSFSDATELFVDFTGAESTFHERGSIAFWMQLSSEPPCNPGRTLFKLQGPSWTYGPALTCEPDGLRLRVVWPNGGYVQALQPAISTVGGGGWAQVVAIWNKAGHTMSVMVNALYLDNFDDWIEFPAGQTPSQVVFGAQSASIGGTVDQISFWDRPISLEEARALYLANGDILSECP